MPPPPCPGTEFAFVAVFPVMVSLVSVIAVPNARPKASIPPPFSPMLLAMVLLVTEQKEMFGAAVSPLK